MLLRQSPRPSFFCRTSRLLLSPRQDLVKLRGEKEGYDARLSRLRGQNESIVKAMASLKVKFGQSMQLLRKYQVSLTDFACPLNTNVHCLWISACHRRSHGVWPSGKRYNTVGVSFFILKLCHNVVLAAASTGTWMVTHLFRRTIVR